ncbi:hypothetical protein KY321_01225, partial [Candidatus Woesearchaeota archaeon]|nr:hypothetical protein [Candidatus Woesearchaeota archaeon]
MSNSHDSIARDIFQERIKKGLLGPGSDIFVFEKDISEEIIADYPLQRYYTGVLFPEREKVKTFDEKADAELNNETDGEENGVIELGDENPEISPNENGNDNKRKEPNEDDELKISQNTFFPSNIGLTFCVDKNVKELDVEFCFGLYSQINTDVKIKISKEDFDEYINHPSFPFKEIISYDNGYMVLKRKLRGKSRQPRTEEFARFDEFIKSDGFNDSPLKYRFHYFEKLLGRTWKRGEVIVKKTILVSEIANPETIYEESLTKSNDNLLRASYTVRTYSFPKNPGHTYVKIQLANTSDKHPANKFSNANERLNAKSIFQAKIKVIAQELKPYKSYIELNPLDREAEILNYLYKDKFSYGIGHNCSVTWNKSEETIQTTFLPQYDVKDTKNNFSEEDFKDNLNDFLSLNESLDIYSLSHFSDKNQSQIIKQLTSFVDLYGLWI